MNRQHGHCGPQAETDPWSHLDPDPPLLHLHADVGGGHGPSRQDPQAEAAQLDSEQDPRQAHTELHNRLERWNDHRSSGWRHGTWWLMMMMIINLIENDR